MSQAVQVNDQVTAQVADLIKIKIKAEKLHEFTERLQHALDPAQDLNELDTKDVEVLSHPTGLTTIGEPDVIEPGLTTAQALSNAQANKRVVMDYLKVPKSLN